MQAKKITRKIISTGKSSLPVKEEKETVSADSASVATSAKEAASAVEAVPREARPKRFCLFCKHKVTPTYTDIATLRRFLTDRAKIVPKGRSGACSKHQRTLAKNIKYARHLALLPFTPKV